MTVAPAVREAYAPLMHKLQNFYATTGKHLSDTELFIALEQRFGDEILNTICVPFGLTTGSCLIIARQLLRETEVSSASSPGKKRLFSFLDTFLRERGQCA